MTLYSQRDSNIKKTWLLMSVFLILIIGVAWLFSRAYGNSNILWIAVIFSSLTSIVSYWYSDKIVFVMTGAKPIAEQDNQQLFHLVENLCIASGLMMPKIYVMPEAQPNAFATGRDEKHAALAVTVGLLQKLEKVELEGVIAHELSHIKNRDTLVQTVAVVLVGIIAVLSDLFLRMSFWGSRNRDSEDRGSLGAILILVALVAAVLAPIAATLIQLAISRKREFLADASGALMTRYPDGLARALEKIANDQTPMRMANSSTAHLFISSPFKGKQKTSWFVKLFMTHPPVEERIAALQGMKI
ncbi:MAG: M48 family metallopeptidase [Candidatus Pacebacteria bacterium]|nr:M48 family metallopeptidase [Candidatus Paceibacterota bacterium]